MTKKYEAKRNYEGIFILDPDLSEGSRKEEIKKLESMIESHQGTLGKTDIWGRRQLAYSINKKSFGFYVMFVFEGDTTLVAEMERQSRINEAIMRFMVVTKDRFAPDLTDDARGFLTAGPEEEAPSRGRKSFSHSRGRSSSSSNTPSKEPAEKNAQANPE